MWLAMAHIFTDVENIAYQKTLPAKATSACVVYLRDGRALMVKANYKERWTFPGGIIESGESPIVAAARESGEEIGFDPGIENLDFLTVAYSAARNDYPDHVKFVYRSRISPDDANIVLQESEIEDYKWVAIDEISQYANGFGIYPRVGEMLAGDITTIGYIET